VHAIGTLRVQHGRYPIHAMGGPKAGAHQAMGFFAFLFDQAERGVEKDEVIDLIWPDVPLPVADTAFHRTLLGLRGALRAGGLGEAVEHKAGRYFLASGLVSWSDAAEVERLLEASVVSANPQSQAVALEKCRELNRADYMDDCPYYGSSSFVEPRRALLRAVRAAVLDQLAELYEAGGHRALAAMRRAEVEATAGTDRATPTRAPVVGQIGGDRLRPAV
jgi:two-component SAPR family response regulator